MKQGDAWTVLLLVFLLAFAVVIVDERLLRAAIAFVPGLLLAQRALHATTGGEDEPRIGAADRRVDEATRSSVDKLLRHIREFYLTCHLLGTGKISPQEATEKTSQLERELNRILARVTDAARVRSGVRG